MSVIRRNYFRNPRFALDTNSDGLADGIVVSTPLSGSIGAWRTRNDDGSYSQRIAYGFTSGDPSTVSINLELTDVGSFALGNLATASLVVEAVSATGCTPKLTFLLAVADGAYGGANAEVPITVGRLVAGRAGLATTSRIRVCLTVYDFHSGDSFDVTFKHPQIEKAAAATPCFDGFSPDSVWDGPVDASSSTQTTKSVLILGDSLTVGMDTFGVAEGYAARTAAWLEANGYALRLTSLAVAYAQSADIVAAAAAAITSAAPDLCIIEIGTNDASGWPTMVPVDPVVFEANLRTIAISARSAKAACKLVFLSVWQPSPMRDDYDAMVTLVASEYGAPFVDISALKDDAENSGPAGLVVATGEGISDDFHPNSRGHARIAAAVEVAVSTFDPTGFATAAQVAALGTPLQAGAYTAPPSIAALATATNLAAVAAKTVNLPAAPAAVGSAMTLTAPYEAAKSAAPAGAAMTLTSGERTSVASAVSGLATTGLAALKALLDAVKLKSDTLGGAGAITWAYTLTTDGATAIPDAEVWVTSDIGGATVVASGRTNASGVVTFYLDAGTVYVWSQKAGYNFSNPDTEVVA